MTRIGKMTNVETVLLYAKKNPAMTVRQMASDLDLSPAYVHQIMWTLRKQGKLPPSKNPRSQQTNKIEVPKEWEEDAEQMAKEVKKTAGEWKQANPIQPIDGKIDQLEIELARAKIIISYLEQRLYEEINRKGTGY